MAETLELAGITIEVLRKDVKSTTLSVCPPAGAVAISAPLSASNEAVRAFAISKLPWIRKEQAKFRSQERETPREYVERESHYLWGERHLLKIEERDGGSGVRLEHKTIVVSARRGVDATKRQEMIGQWYRDQLRNEVGPLLKKWEALLGVKVTGLYVQHMKTKWGSASPGSGTIRLNSELARKPRECLEYVLVHEMAHLLEPDHGDGFVALMDRVMPGWKQYRELLNSLPQCHEEWRAPQSLE